MQKSGTSENVLPSRIPAVILQLHKNPSIKLQQCTQYKSIRVTDTSETRRPFSHVTVPWCTADDNSDVYKHKFITQDTIYVRVQFQYVLEYKFQRLNFSKM